MLTGGALQNRGAPGSAREGADGGFNEGKQQEKHLREHSPEHPDFGEHPREHSWELFWGFSIFDQSPRPGSSQVSIAKNHAKLSHEFSEQFRPPSTHRMKGFSRNSLQKVHPNFAQNLGRQILGNTFSGLKFGPPAGNNNIGKI